MIKRANRACKYFPCHKGLEDCTFCYCPFYPCLDEMRGEYIYSPKLGKNIWSCQKCGWIHKSKNVNSIFSLIRKHTFKPRVLARKAELKKTGIIIIGHGSKLKKANETIMGVVKEIRKQNWDIVEAAYLQFHQPDLDRSIEGVVKKGCKRIIIVPFFLFMGNHVKRDIPKAIKAVKAKHPEVEFIYAKNIGEDTRIKKIVLDRINETVSQCG